MTKTSTRRELSDFLGYSFGTAASTFVQVPSAQMLSLLCATFFPSAVGVYKGSEISFFSNAHPYVAFQNAERRMLSKSTTFGFKSFEASVQVAATVLPAAHDRQPWRLVRVDAMNLTTIVNHHFDFERDGHQRKYKMRCETPFPGGQPKVYLVRTNDGFSIPYETIDSVTLIALLRMGLISPIKIRFYEHFLKLPLYEDMAPWNIVFRYGSLDYIDYDTKVSCLGAIINNYRCSCHTSCQTQLTTRRQ